MDTTNKVIKVSLNGSDSSPTWRALPAPSGSFSKNGETLDDSIFGANFASIQMGLIDCSISSSALYRGFAGYVATIKKSGTSTSFTTEACSLVSGYTYQIDDTTKRCWDWTKTFTVYNDAVEVSSSLYTIDFMHGKITFSGAGIPASADAITVSGYYLPLTTFSSANDISMGMTANTTDQTSFASAQANGGYMSYGYGLKTVNLSLSGFYETSTGIFALLEAREPFVIEICPDGNAKSIARGVFMVTSQDQDGAVGDTETESVEFSSYVGEDVNGDAITPFNWHHESDTTLSQAIQDVLYAWENNAYLWAQYLPDGTNGAQVKTLVTDCSFSTGVSAMATYAVNLQGTDGITELS